MKGKPFESALEFLTFLFFFVAQNISGKSRCIKHWVMALVRLRGEQAGDGIE